MSIFRHIRVPALAGAIAALLIAANALADGGSLLPKKKGQVEFLPVDQAFELQPLERRDGKLIVSWRIARDYYLYRDRLKFTLVEPAGAKLGAAQLPAADQYRDEYFGETDIYRDRLQAELPLAGAKAGAVKLTVAYQGCANAGLCYPVQTRTLVLTGDGAN